MRRIVVWFLRPLFRTLPYIVYDLKEAYRIEKSKIMERHMAEHHRQLMESRKAFQCQFQ